MLDVVNLLDFFLYTYIINEIWGKVKFSCFRGRLKNYFVRRIEKLIS